MTDANGITISNITANAAVWAPGEPVSISFKFKNGSGAKITDLYLGIIVQKTDFSGAASIDRIVLAMVTGEDNFMQRVNLANGKSRTFTATFNVPDTVSAYFTEYPDIRSAPIYIDYSAYDSSDSGFGTEFELSDLRILNHRFTPQITAMNLIRAKDGLPNDEGENVLTTLKLAVDGGGYDYSRFLTAKLHYAQGDSATTADTAIDLTGNIADLLSGAENDPDLIPGTYDKAYDWDFLLVFGDEYESFIGRFNLGMAFANMHLSGLPTGGVCFGGFSSSKYGKPRLQSYYPIQPFGGIEAVEGGIYSQELSFDASAPFRVYADNPLPPTLRVFGHVVELQGEIQPTKTISGGTTYHPICTIPEQYAPMHDVCALQQGSGQSVWMLRIFGRNHPEHPCQAMFTRYRSGASWADVSSSGWLPMHAAWCIDGAVSGDSEALAALLLDAEGNPVQDVSGSDIAVMSAADAPYQLPFTGEQIEAKLKLADTSLQRSGGTMTGELSLTFTPTEDSHAVNKGYVDDEISKIELIPGKSAYEYAQEGGYAGTEEEFGSDLNNAIQGGGDDSVAWEDITGKPFGGPITGTATIDGDTLNWDGDSASMPVSIGNQYSNWNYVSANVPTKAQLQAGYELYWMTYTGTEVKISTAPTYSDNGNIYIGDLDGQYLRIVAVPDETYTRTGVYFYGGTYGHVSRLKISGFAWTESAEAAPIPKSMLPDDTAYLGDVAAAEARANASIKLLDDRFEDTTIRAITFDAAIEDRLVVSDAITGGTFAHVSYDAPPASLMENGYELTLLGETGSYTGFTYQGDGYYNLMGTAVWVIMRDNVSVSYGDSTTLFPKKGTYFAVSGGNKIVSMLTSAAMQAQAAAPALKEQYIPALSELIMLGPDGRKYRITIDASGSLVPEPI